MNTAIRTVLSYPLAPFDADTRAYIKAVEAADGQPLEAGVRRSLDAFVRGCKSDGIWDAIKASCVMMGARTLAGALVPLKGAAPTNFNFVSGDYDRKTGLVGDGTTKYLDSNRNNNADPQNSKHVFVFQTSDNTYISIQNAFGDSVTGGTMLRTTPSIRSIRLNSNGTNTTLPYAFVAGGWGATRSDAVNATYRYGGSDTVALLGSATPNSHALTIFAASEPSTYSDGRFSFYSIGESLNLALLDARVTALSTAISTAF